jgi:UDP-2,4-diacetamido-2,4,6-trideoxy-beta-L-altropyranose hydrolase
VRGVACVPAPATPPVGVDVFVTDAGVGEWLAAADVVVTAGGVTLLESLFLGRPTIAIALADNQRRAIATAHREGACVATDVGAAAEACVALLGDLEARRRLSDNAQRLVDGRGAARIAGVVQSLVQGHPVRS